MRTKTTNENLVNISNQIQTKQKMIDKVDKLLLERLPDLISDELKWIRKEYGDDEISEFLCGDEYYNKSILLKKMDELYK